MAVGTQIALEFPESSQPPPTSREKVHFAKNEPETASPRRVLADPPGNLQDLLGAIAISGQLQPDQQAMLRSTVAHLSRFLAHPPAELEIATLADSLQRFKDYLLNRRFKRNSVRAYMNYAQLLLRAARALGWSEASSGVVEAWKKVLPIGKRYHCATVGGYAIRKGLTPSQFTEAQLEEMAQTMVIGGRTFHYATQMQWRFRKCVHESGLQKDFPGISPPRKKTLYGIPLSKFPDTLRNEVSNLLAWKTDPYVDDRPLRSRKLRPPSAARLKENLCQLYGFANNIRGFDPSTLAELFSQECLGEFLKWSETERKVKMSSLLKSVWMIVPIVRDYPTLRGRDFSWIGNRLAAMRIRVEHSPSEGAACGVEYDSLARIPALIRREADKCNPERGKKKAAFIRDQLLIMMLVVLAWRQRNVRECKLSDRKDGGNLFKEEVSPRSRTALPNSVLAALEQNPHQKFWQFYFRPDETKAGRAVHAFVPKQLVPLLEEYVELYRPSLIGNSDPGTLLVNDHGRPFETSALRVRVKNLTVRYAGQVVRPHQFRHAFAFKWLKDHPEDYLTLSKHLWHFDVKVTIGVYGRDFDESYAACRVEDWFGG